MSRVLAVLALAGLAGCVNVERVSRKPDVTRPADEVAVIDFATLFSGSFASNSVYTDVSPGLMRRVLLSPNLVFESSRSSMKEPKTVGPDGAGPETPSLADALGKGISTEMSSVLMRHLVSKGSTLIAPLASSLWDYKGWCVSGACPDRTWVERTMAIYRSYEKPPSDFPTAALAVRSLGIVWRNVPVVVGRDERGAPVVRPRRFESEESACGQMEVQVPTVSFSAEIVSLKDGQVLARIDEERVPKINVYLTRSVVVSTFRPQQNSDYTEFANGIPEASSAYQYVAGWEREYVACNNIKGAFNDVQSHVVRETNVPAMTTEILAKALEPLYR